jgi:septal ring factor EnvC (AmiA/AmiB activator)
MKFPPFNTITGKKSSIILFAVTIIPAFLLIASLFCYADDVEQLRLEEQQRIEQEIKRNQIKIQRLQEGLESQQSDMEQTRLREKGILAELEDIDQRLLKMAERLRELSERKTLQQNLIAAKEQELEEVRKKSEKVQLHMQKRIGAYYKLGKIDLINITFSTQTLPELLRFHDGFQKVIEYDQELMKRYRYTIDNLEGVKEALTLEKGLLDVFIEQANDKEKSFLEVKEEKTRLHNRVKTQAALHKQAIKEIEKAKTDLSAALLGMREKEQFFDQGFLMNKKSHIPPVDGVVTTLFNQERINQFGIMRKDPGIAVTAIDGAKIHAVYDGEVVYSGYLKGYGNTVIIDHGYQYFTITSRIERMLVTKGTNVKRNDIIGIMGSTATISDDGLYFEIRHEEKPMDPLEWLDSKKLQFKRSRNSSSNN